MKTLYDRLNSEPFEFAISNFIDEFNASPQYELIAQSVLTIGELTDTQKSMVAAIVDELCYKFMVSRPLWIFDSSTYLPSPVFAADAKGPLRIILLQESPRWYRSRNLFVSKNFINRV